jgi:hypothetical protein
LHFELWCSCALIPHHPVTPPRGSTDTDRVSHDPDPLVSHRKEIATTAGKMKEGERGERGCDGGEGMAAGGKGDYLFELCWPMLSPIGSPVVIDRSAPTRPPGQHRARTVDPCHYICDPACSSDGPGPTHPRIRRENMVIDRRNSSLARPSWLRQRPWRGHGRAMALGQSLWGRGVL